MDISETADNLSRLKEKADVFFNSLCYVHEEEKAPSFAASMRSFTTVGDAKDYWSQLSRDHQIAPLQLQRELLTLEQGQVLAFAMAKIKT
jgi:hypothetical protein